MGRLQRDGLARIMIALIITAVKTLHTNRDMFSERKLLDGFLDSVPGCLGFSIQYLLSLSLLPKQNSPKKLVT